MNKKELLKKIKNKRKKKEKYITLNGHCMDQKEFSYIDGYLSCLESIEKMIGETKQS